MATKKSTSKSTKSTTKKRSSKKSTTEKVIESAAKAVVKSKSPALKIIVAILIVAIVGVCVYGYFNGWFDGILNGNNVDGGNTINNKITYNNPDYNVSTIASEDLSFHFLQFGNKYAGDSIYIKAGTTDILIDAGSRQGSAPTLAKYINQYCTDGKLEYVIATHADQDHIAGFVGSDNQGIFDVYKVGTLIDFNLTNKDEATASGGRTLYGKYVDKRTELIEEGTVHYYALECYNETGSAKRTYQLSDDVQMQVLYNYYYENKSSDENNYSVCLLFTQYDDAYDSSKSASENESYVHNYLFTGDLEKSGEEKLVQNNTLPKVELFKAGHHGSPTSSNDCLLSVIQPKVVCVCCCAGTDEYSDNISNQFPSQAFIDRVAPYTDAVYVTTMVSTKTEGYEPMNGEIVFACTNGTITMYFTNNNTKLKDTDWFKNSRTCPASWSN